MEIKTGNWSDQISWILQNTNSELCALMIHGFERASTSEQKYRILSQKLSQKNISNISVDFVWTGVSIWDFANNTISYMTIQLELLLSELKNKWFKKFVMIWHSLWCAIISNIYNKSEYISDIYKSILIAPALNQIELNRYWFVKWKMWKSDPNIKIDWSNYKQYFDENEYQKSFENWKITKMNFIKSDYFAKWLDFDFNKNYQSLSHEQKMNILVIYGDKDETVPQISNDFDFTNKIIVKWWDHDMEKPWQYDQWIDKAINFIW